MATKRKRSKILSKTSGQISRKMVQMVLGTPSIKIVQIILIDLKI